MKLKLICSREQIVEVFISADSPMAMVQGFWFGKHDHWLEKDSPGYWFYVLADENGPIGKGRPMIRPNKSDKRDP